MFFPDELIEDIRMKNDIVDVIGGYVKLKKQGSTYFGLCPFHNEKSPSFSVTPSKQMYYCFGCGEGGNVITFIMKYENYNFVEAVEMLAEKAGVELPKAEYSKEAQERADLRKAVLEANKEAAKYFYHMLKTEHGSVAYRYLKERGLSDETITGFGLGYSDKVSGGLYAYLKGKGFKDQVLKETGLFTYDRQNVGDKFFNRVMFPIMDVNNRVIAFGGRVMGDGKPKYLNSPETKVFDKSRNLYGLNVARTSRKNYLLICEGYMDVISLHQAGFNNAVAALGTSFTSGHASLIKRYAKEVVLTFDSDEAGRKAAMRAIPILKGAGIAIKVLDMKPYKDPDEFIKALGPKAYEERINNATNYFIFEVGQVMQNYDLSDPQGKTDFHNQVAQMLLEFPDEIERINYIDAVSGIYGIPRDALDKLVKRKALTYTPGSEKQRSTDEINKVKKVVEDGTIKAQKILITWIIEEPELFGVVSEYIEPEDFVDPFYREVAGIFWEQLQNGEVNPAKIIDHFVSEEEHKKAAGLFNSPLSEKLTQTEKERALNDTIIKIKKNSLDYQAANAKDIAQMQKIIMEQTKLQKIHIRL
ncbi:MAG: DNA primase [Lachnospiraceae bacterium]|nr:DNA primase [Lachnospiraceae bacterium]